MNPRSGGGGQEVDNRGADEVFADHGGLSVRSGSPSNQYLDQIRPAFFAKMTRMAIDILELPSDDLGALESEVGVLRE